MFLDATKAYDKIDRHKLWQTLGERGMSSALIELLQLLYEDNRIILKHGCYASDELSLSVGLRKFCPLSPILFSLHIGGLEKQLLDTEVRVRLLIKRDFWNAKNNKYFKIPGMLFADDLLLMANKWTDMEKLLEVTSNFGDNMSIKFNPQKSGVMVFSNPDHFHSPDRNLKIQGREPHVQSYKYLGINLSAGTDILSQHVDELRKKANQAIQRLNARSL